jgi:membrane-associated phospholipid phosphatase
MVYQWYAALINNTQLLKIIFMNYKKIFLFIFLQLSFVSIIIAQDIDTTGLQLQKNEKAYFLKNEETLIYKEPVSFGFIKDLPKAVVGMVSTTFRKKSIKPLLLIGAATGVLLLSDELIANNVQQFSQKIHFHSAEKNITIWAVNIGKKPTTILKAPGNINTALYQIGQGFPGLILGAGLFISGKINHNYRSISTAAQLTESFILMGVTTQILKRLTGRQSPETGNENSGQWKLMPSFKNFQTKTSKFDAFPSGHLATLMSTVTIFTENYPEKKWIKPVGYSLTGLVALAMINNNAHWASDYPLALGLGYLCAHTVAKQHISIAGRTVFNNKDNKLSFSFDYANGHVMPACIYKL